MGIPFSFLSLYIWHFRSIQTDSKFAFRRRRLPRVMSARFRPTETVFDFVHSEIPFNLSQPHLRAALRAIPPLRVYARRGTTVINSSLICSIGSLPADAAQSPAEEEVHTVPGRRIMSLQSPIVTHWLGAPVKDPEWEIWLDLWFLAL